MTLNNGAEMEIKKSWYNKAKLQDDGVTYITDTEHQYTVYQFGMAKNYFDTENKEEVVGMIIEDLQSTILQLQQMLEKEKEGKQEEREEGR